MDKKKKATRRKAREKKTKTWATVTFWLLALTITLCSVYIIYSTLNTPLSPPRRPDVLIENPYGPEDFLRDQSFVTCTAGPTRVGIDVSAHQGPIDWEAVRSGGIDFAFIRIGYRGYSVGIIKPDDRARENLAAAKEAGLQVGVYFYAQAITPEEAAEEASWCLDFLRDETLDLPVVYDWEWAGPDSRTGPMDKETLTECVKVFCDAIEQAGYQSMVYFNNHVARDLMDLQALARYPFWLAQYKDAMDFPWRVDFWQFTEEGTVPGIEGSVDIDLMFIYE